MISYDKRFYHDRQMEPFSDPEWEEAENADEKPVYWWCEEYFGGKYIIIKRIKFIYLEFYNILFK